LVFDWEVDARFEGQFFEFVTPVPRTDLSQQSIDEFREEFIRTYEERFGEETAWRDSRIEIVNCRMRAREPKEAPQLRPHALAPSSLKDCIKSVREAYMSPDVGIGSVNVYDGRLVNAGTVIPGAAIIEEDLTTILIAPDFVATKDRYENYVLKATKVSP